MTEKEQEADYLKKGYAENYGFWWPPGYLEAAIEQGMYLGLEGQHSSPHFLGQKEHFKRFMSLVFAHEKCQQPFEWNPNAELILDEYFANKWTCIAGHGSSAKTRTVAGIAVAQFLMDPENTSCLLTSTTLPDGKRRVWADVERFWFDAGTYFGEENMPGELVRSIAIIRYVDKTGSRLREDEARGLALIPSGNDDDAKAGISKMIGFKAPIMRVFLDEASHISWKVVEAAETNLETSTKDFKVVATLNPNNRGDTGGKLCRPKGGNWKSVDTTVATRWENDRGVTLRLGAYESPNVKLALDGKCAPGDQPWSGLLDLERLEAKKASLSAANFQRQYLAIWPEGEIIETIFTDAEVRHHFGHVRVERIAEIIADVWGGDPSFTHDGDGFPLVKIGLLRDDEGRVCAQYERTVWLDRDLDPTMDKNIQTRDKFVRLAPGLGIVPRDFGMDVTGGGGVLYSMFVERWPGAMAMLGVTFNGAASDKPVSALDKRLANEVYANLNAELWLFAKELLMSGQLKNLPESVISQICKRRYGDNNGRDKNGRMTIESTKEFKKREGYSPDEASALFVALYLAKMRYSLTASAKPAKAQAKSQGPGMWDFSNLIPQKKSSFAASTAKFRGLQSRPYSK